jgi:hypothetical protein
MSQRSSSNSSNGYGRDLERVLGPVNGISAHTRPRRTAMLMLPSFRCRGTKRPSESDA